MIVSIIIGIAILVGLWSLFIILTEVRRFTFKPKGFGIVSGVVPHFYRRVALKPRDFSIVSQMATTRLLNEEVFRFKGAFWDRICLDMTVHVIDIKRLGQDLSSPMMIQKKKTGLDYPEPLKSLEPIETQRLLGAFFDEKAGAFRQTDDTWADAYSIDDAFRLIFRYTNYGENHNLEERKREEILKYFGDWINGCRKFIIENCYDKTSGLFSNDSYEEATIATTFSCLKPLHELKKHGIEAFEGFDKKKTAAEILKNYKKVQNSKVAFSNVRLGEPLVCATFYVLVTLYCVLPEEDIQREINGEGILNYLDKCWVEKEGLYAATPSHIPSLIHTRYALVTIRQLIDKNLIDKSVAVNRVKAAKLLHSVNSCELYGGFAPRPDFAPSIFSTRVAFQIADALRYLEYIDVIDPTPDYKKEMQKFLTKMENVDKFLNLCKHEGTGRYAGYPLSQSYFDQSIN